MALEKNLQNICRELNAYNFHVREYMYIALENIEVCIQMGIRSESSITNKCIKDGFNEREIEEAFNQLRGQ